MRRSRLDALAAEATAVVAAVEPAEADSNAGSVVIRVAIIGSQTRAVDWIAGSVIRRRTARGVWAGLLRLIVAGSDIAEGLRCAIG